MFWKFHVVQGQNTLLLCFWFVNVSLVQLKSFDKVCIIEKFIQYGCSFTIITRPWEAGPVLEVAITHYVYISWVCDKVWFTGDLHQCQHEGVGVQASTNLGRFFGDLVLDYGVLEISDKNTIDLLVFFSYYRWTKEIEWKYLLKLFDIFFDSCLSLGGFISALVLDLTDFFVSRLILQVLVDCDKNIKLETVFVLLILLIDSCFDNRLGNGSTKGLGLSKWVLRLCKLRLFLSEFFIGFRNGIFPKLLELIGLTPRSINIDANNSIVLFTQERSETIKVARRAIRRCCAVL